MFYQKFIKEFQEFWLIFLHQLFFRFVTIRMMVLVDNHCQPFTICFFCILLCNY